MRRKLLLIAFSANVLWSGECVRPATTIRSADSAFAFSIALVAALATAHLAYEESLLSPERTPRSRELGPLAAAKGCVDVYMAPFLQSQMREIREAASTVQLAMAILTSNEREVSEELARMSKRKATTGELVAYLKKYLESGQGRWSIFLNAATSTMFSIGRFENLESEKPVLLLALQSDEAALLRLEILRHFLSDRLMQPRQLRPSPERAAAMLYGFLRDGKDRLAEGR